VDLPVEDGFDIRNGRDSRTDGPYRSAFSAALAVCLPLGDPRGLSPPVVDIYSMFTVIRHPALHGFFPAYRIEELLLRRDWPQPLVLGRG
jgi:hypothetical protein